MLHVHVAYSGIGSMIWVHLASSPAHFFCREGGGGETQIQTLFPPPLPTKKRPGDEARVHWTLA